MAPHSSIEVLTMKYRLFGVVVCLSFIIVFSVTAPAQKIGGYKEISAKDAGAKAAAEFAVSSQGEKTK